MYNFKRSVYQMFKNSIPIKESEYLMLTIKPPSIYIEFSISIFFVDPLTVYIHE